MRKLLLVDDEPHIHFTVGQVFADQPVRVLSAETADTALQVVQTEQPEVVLLDIRLGQCSGLELFHELTSIAPKVLVIFITGHGTTDTAIEAMKLGAFEYLVKPLDFTRLREVVGEAFEICRLMHVHAEEEDANATEFPDQIIAESLLESELFGHESVEAALANRESDLYRRAIEQFDRELVMRALAQVGGHQANAATLLGLSRPTLRAKLRALGMTMEKVASANRKSSPDIR